MKKGKCRDKHRHWKKEVGWVDFLLEIKKRMVLKVHKRNLLQRM
jgi:hypothetical protein